MRAVRVAAAVERGGRLQVLTLLARCVLANVPLTATN